MHADAAANATANATATAHALRKLPVLAPFYYLKNFELVLTTILARYSDLLLEDELRFITQFPLLPLESRALLTRMIMRRGDFFRASKLNYAEIGEPRAAAAALIKAGWASDRPLLSIRDLHGLLTKEELIRCLKLPSRYAAWRKPELAVLLEAQRSMRYLYILRTRTSSAQFLETGLVWQGERKVELESFGYGVCINIRWVGRERTSERVAGLVAVLGFVS